MDFLDELESMAQFAVSQPGNVEPDCDDIKRWQSLFGSYSDAAKKIQDQRSDLARVQVSEVHWEMVRAEKQAQGYDKESYEYSCSLPQRISHAVDKKTKKKQKLTTYLLKLEGLFSTPEDVKIACGSSMLLPKFSGTDDEGTAASFCKVDEPTKKILLNHLSAIESTFQPTFIRYSKAEKNLSATSAHPTLGFEATLPHNRPTSSSDQRLLPTQDQYPVWYFFYGTLADPGVLNNLLGIEKPVYRAAKIRGGRLTTWGGKYKALVDASAYEVGCVVEGHAFLVTSKDQEDALQCYETDNYEVV
ncbi:hypothetical protein CORC01_02238 [Colletotrichum orchidophilum]|uniref:Putative gamma-glutamylcyclotransferase n=1 Tax=Colletotrichum orchidophilum TaxID=1209926 RepID=A0A1G4BMM7_9PEZI|nr:uncharacterized protein CORC01_02238 [Colletotrichum orchidophilum]OHF02543.1 hypothetical protein CORC01_02238 [Colletotrichum orchidophilum]